MARYGIITKRALFPMKQKMLLAGMILSLSLPAQKTQQGMARGSASELEYHLLLVKGSPESSIAAVAP